MKRATLWELVALVLFTIASSTAFFHYVEGWSWLDAYFFTVVTLSTVGYGSLVPETALGKIATTFLIFFGIAVLIVGIQQATGRAFYRRYRRRQDARDRSRDD